MSFFMASLRAAWAFVAETCSMMEAFIFSMLSCPTFLANSSFTSGFWLVWILFTLMVKVTVLPASGLWG